MPWSDNQWVGETNKKYDTDDIRSSLSKSSGIQYILPQKSEAVLLNIIIVSKALYPLKSIQMFLAF